MDMEYLTVELDLDLVELGTPLRSRPRGTIRAKADEMTIHETIITPPDHQPIFWSSEIIYIIFMILYQFQDVQYADVKSIPLYFVCRSFK